MFTHQVATLLCVKGQHGHHFEIMVSNQKSNSSVDAYLREEHSCQISSRSVLKQQNLRLLGDDVTAAVLKV